MPHCSPLAMVIVFCIVALASLIFYIAAVVEGIGYTVGLRETIYIRGGKSYTLCSSQLLLTTQYIQLAGS